MPLQNKQIATLHGIVLLIGTFVGFTGRYIQFHDIRLTALIPGSFGLLIIVLATTNWARDEVRNAACFVVILVFGIILTRMSLKFVFQDFQPLRKRINFPAMAISSITALVLLVKNYRG